MRDRGVERDDRVGQDQEVGTAADALDGIGGVGLAGVEVGAGGRRQVSAGREAHHADAIGGNAELRRAGAHEANRALRVAELDRVAVPWARAGT